MSVFRIGCDNRIAQDRAVYLDVLRIAAKRLCEQLAVPEVAIVAARCPPAEKPHTIILSGSMSNFSALSLTYLTAAAHSKASVGNFFLDA